jgi:hypothetical protein
MSCQILLASVRRVRRINITQGNVCHCIAFTQLSLSSSPRFIMSAGPSTSTFASIFNTSLESYKRKTKRDLTSHPLLPSLQSCDSPEAVLTVLREQIPALNQSHDGDDRLTKWVFPTVNVLYAFSATVGQGVGLVCIGFFVVENFRFNIYHQAFPAANAIFAGIGVLLVVSILHLSLAQTILGVDTGAPRQLKMRALAKKR